jgi:two-component system, OmpR family, heavy metal sensor histidine kinase CusS
VTRSLRFRLSIAVVAVLAGVLATFAVVVHLVLEQALIGQLDVRLAAEAAAVAGMAEDDPAGPEFEYESLPEFERSQRPGYFEAWLDDEARPFARSPSLGTRDLPQLGPQPGRPTFVDLTLPDGRPGRAIELRQPLRIEDGPPGAGPSKRLVTVAVAEGTEEVRETLATMSRWLWALALAAFAAAAAATFLLVARGLGPTRVLAAQIERLHVEELDRPLPTTGLPEEIEPVVRKLNELLARLSASFARERRLPLAALRTTLEVAAAQDRPASAYRAAIGDATALVAQTQALVANLLMLARLDARQIDVETRDVGLRALVDDCWRPFEAQAAERRLRFANEIAPDTTVATDPDKLRIVVSNLLSNAAAYTAAGGSIAARDGDGRDDTVLEVADSGPPIPDELLPRLFDRFSRGDAARSSGVHCGIGLALVRGVCPLLGLEATAENAADGSVCFRIAGVVSVKGRARSSPAMPRAS